MKRSKLLIVLLITCFLFTNIGAIDTFAAPVPEKLVVHYMDVGQADSILVQLPDSKNLLIDAGDKSSSTKVVDYIKKLNIKKLDYVIATHPHEDHIGGMLDVIKTFEIGQIYMPKVVHTTEVYKNLLLGIQSKGLKISDSKVGVKIIDSQDVKLTILAPSSGSYSELNDWSVVTKLTYKSNSFLFSGDAALTSENEMLKNKEVLKADVLKVGHHGSKTSTGSEFLKAVSPKYAVISVGKGNSYGHPTQETLNRLAVSKVEIFRTDIAGTIIAKSDGTTITFDKLAKLTTPTVTTVPPPVIQPRSTQVFITKTGEKYHKDGCSSLAKSKIPIELSEAIEKGYTPCSKCKP